VEYIYYEFKHWGKNLSFSSFSKTDARLTFFRKIPTFERE
jgi:hypothetical protein